MYVLMKMGLLPLPMHSGINLYLKTKKIKWVNKILSKYSSELDEQIQHTKFIV